MKHRIKKLLVIAWLTVLWFSLLGNVHAWDVPGYLRVDSGTRLWFSVIEGDLIQPDRTKIGFVNNMGLQQDQVSWEFFTGLRVENIHVFRVRVEPETTYGPSRNDSFQRVRNVRVGYDLDFYMTPQLLFGAHGDLDVLTLHTEVNDVTVGGNTYDYGDRATRVLPSLGVHGSFFPIISGVALRPNISTRVNWWDYETVEMWDWNVTAAVHIPVNALWTWTVSGGYRIWSLDIERDSDRLDMTRRGFFLEAGLLF